jgi:predicted nucleic acid-binding protein
VEAASMMLQQYLKTVQRLFLDTAPLIYYVEEHPRYITGVDIIFASLDAGDFEAITSPVTLAECLIIPYRDSDVRLQQAFLDLVFNGVHTHFVEIDREIGALAAQLRACYNLGLPDAFQCAVALHSGCDAFLTNDISLKRVTELRVIVLEEMCD